MDDIFLTLMKYELKKLVVRRLTILSFLIMAGLLLFASAQRFLLTEDNMKMAHQTESFLENARMDDDFFTDLNAHWNVDGDNPYRFAVRLVSRVFRMNMSENALWSQSSLSRGRRDAKHFYAYRQEYISEIKKTFFLTEDEYAYWDKQEEAIEKPFVYRSTNAVLMIKESYQMVAVVTFLLIGLGVSGIFADEVNGRTDALIYSSRHGRKKIFGAKLLSGILFSLGLGCLLLLAAHLPVFAFKGLHGLDAPWTLVVPFSSINKTAGEMLVLHTVVFLSGCVLTGVLTAVCSLLLRHTIGASGMITGIILLDLFLSVPTSLRYLSQIQYLTPVSVLINSFIQDYRLSKIFGRWLITFQSAPLLYAGLLIFLLLLSALLFRRTCERNV